MCRLKLPQSATANFKAPKSIINFRLWVNMLLAIQISWAWSSKKLDGKFKARPSYEQCRKNSRECCPNGPRTLWSQNWSKCKQSLKEKQQKKINSEIVVSKLEASKKINPQQPSRKPLRLNGVARQGRHREKSILSNLTKAFAIKWRRRVREASRKIDPRQPHGSFCD